MNQHRKPSKKDYAKKFSRLIPESEPDITVWEVLGEMVDGLSNESWLPKERLQRIIRSRDVRGYVELSKDLPYAVYGDPAMLLRDRSIVELFKKYPFSNSPFNTREQAEIRFWQAEKACLETNRRVLSDVVLEGYTADVINRAVREIAKLLGRFNIEQMLSGSRFGPGSTLCVSGAFTTQYFKLSEKEPTVSSDAFAYAEALLNYDRKWLAHLCGIHPLDVVGRFDLVSDEVAPELRITDYNKVSFVPKDAKTDRSIAIEPYFNLYFQLGMGKILREKLRLWGVNLDSQTRNQDLAATGSITDELATVDFSMASDTISLETVRLMLPPEWFYHLDRLRSRKFKLNGEIHTAHKFSTMGNGFTFELESLIFAAVARASHAIAGVPESEVAVYGDDVIVHRLAYDIFVDACKHLGFTVNAEKSFVQGPFRESCGKDFLEGENVRPVFCKELSNVRDAVSLSNRLKSLQRRLQAMGSDSCYLNGAIDVLLRKIPRDLRRDLVGPITESMDTHIHTDDVAELAQSRLVVYQRSTFSWVYPVIAFRAKCFRRKDASLSLMIHQVSHGGEKHDQSYRYFTPFVKRGVNRPDGISRLSGYTVAEVVPMEITGREVGEFSLSTTARDGLLADPTF